MSWHFKDSTGTRGPFTETQIRDLIKQADDTEEVRQGNSNWIAAAVARGKFEQLEREEEACELSVSVESVDGPQCDIPPLFDAKSCAPLPGREKTFTRVYC